MPRNTPPNRPRRHQTPAPNPGRGTVVLPGVFETRLPNNRRKAFDGVLYRDVIFDDVIEVFKRRTKDVHEVVKGLFKKHPELIHSSPQQIAVEVAMQFIGARTLTTESNTSMAQLRTILGRLIMHMPTSNISLAMSRMKLHDRDLEEDEDAKDEIEIWREDHGPNGDPNARRNTLAKTRWVGAAQAARKYADRANGFRSRHPQLRNAPVLELCTETDGKHEIVTMDYINTLYPEVA